MWIERQLSGPLRSLVKTFPVVVLSGPRQTGKTSLLERTFPEFPVVSLDVGAEAEMADTRPADFLIRHQPPVMLDEIQYAPSFFRAIKAEVDRRRGTNGLFLLTGSQSLVLMQAVSESLAGRAAVVPFLGLSGAEWAAVPELHTRHDWREFVFRGSYPALWADLAAPPSRDRWYQGYLATYLERDVRNLLNVGSLRDFERFLRAAAARTGQLLNMSELGRDVGISASTARQWLSVLQASNQIVLLEPYHRSLGKRLVKSPKLYFTDSGLAAFLMGFPTAGTLWQSQQAGALWETYVIGQWLRWRDWNSPSTGLWFWRDQSGNEVDLLLEVGRGLIAIEIKIAERPTARDLHGIAALRKLYGDKTILAAYVACTTQEPFVLGEAAEARNGLAVWPLELD
jgi:predicted AAA+ superfamily ATPase